MYKSRYNQRFEKIASAFFFSTMDEPQHAKAGRARQSKAQARKETNQQRGRAAAAAKRAKREREAASVAEDRDEICDICSFLFVSFSCVDFRLSNK